MYVCIYIYIYIFIYIYVAVEKGVAVVYAELRGRAAECELDT